MRFGGSLHRLLDCILSVEPAVGPELLCKVYLVDTYIHIWLSPEDVPSIAFLITKETADDDQLVGFHLYTTIGYMEPNFFLCPQKQKSIGHW